MKDGKEEARKWRVRLIHHGDHAAGHQHAVRFAQEACHIRDVMKDVGEQQRAHGVVAEGEHPAVEPAPGLGPLRLAQLVADLRLTPEERVWAHEHY